MKVTQNKCSALIPGKVSDINIYPDAYFARLYVYESNYDPICVGSRAGFVIKAGKCTGGKPEDMSWNGGYELILYGI